MSGVADRPRVLRQVFVLALLLGPPAAAQERLVDQAQAAFAQADSAGRTGTSAGLLEAIALFVRAGELYHQIPDPSREAASFYWAGSLSFKAGRTDTAIVQLRRALAIVVPTSDTAGEIDTRNIFGQVFAAIGQRDSALAHHRAALDLAKQAADQKRMATSLNHVGQIQLYVGLIDSAAVHFREALVLSQAVGYREEEGLALGNIGWVFAANGRPDSAIHYYLRGLDIATELGHHQVQGSLLYNVGHAHASTGQFDSALVYYSRALAMRRESGERGAEGWTLNALGSIYQSIGRTDSAVGYLQSALAISREVDDPQGESTALGNLAAVYDAMGLPDSALNNFHQVVLISRDIDDPGGEGWALSNIAAIYVHLGQIDSSLVYERQALAIHQAVGDRAQEAVTLGGIGNAHHFLGRWDSALTYFNRALAITRDIGDPSEQAGWLINIGDTYGNIGQPDSALIYFHSGLDVARAVGNRPREAIALGNIGKIKTDLAQADSALRYYRQSLTIRRDIRDRLGEGRTLHGIGRAHALAGAEDSALIAYSTALAVMRENQDAAGESRALGGIGMLLATTGALGQAVAYFDSAAAVVAAIRRNAGNDANRLSYAEGQTRTHNAWVLAWIARADAVGPQSSAMAALSAADRARAQGLLDLMRGAASSLREDGAGRTRPGADLVAEADSLLRPLREARTAALSYLVASDTLVTWLLQPDGDLRVFQAAISQDSLAMLVESLRFGIGADSARRGMARGPAGEPLDQETTRGLRRRQRLSLERASSALSAILLPPGILSTVPAGSEIVIVAHDVLGLVPFGVLPTGREGAALGLRNALRYSPSFAALVSAEDPRRGSGPPRDAGMRALIVGNPLMPAVIDDKGKTASLTPLPGAGEEARSIAALLGTTAISGSSASETAVRRQLPAVSLLHLATHGLAFGTEENARLSYVALAADSSNDGLLTMGELLTDPSLHMSAGLVVLSACQTGLGDLKQAEGTVGLQRAFLARGARSVLVSLWSVNDQSTRLLMERFYGHWVNDPDHPGKAEALRRAQVDVRGTAGFSHPRFWAAFQMVGAR
jgi:CHAT domain-containing protein/tetratricopeptide (TPR) repeat protein